MEFNDLIQIAGILIGFQLTIFTFRISRELTFKKKHRRLPIPDIINLLSILITVFFLILYPLKYPETYDKNICQKLLGFSFILFVIYPFALIGHYDLFVKNKNEFSNYATKQEKIVLFLGTIISILYFVI